RDVEDALAGHHADVVDEVLRDRHGQGGDLVVVAAAPDLLLLVAERGVGGELGGDGHGGALRVSGSRGRGCDGGGGGRRDVLVPQPGAVHGLGDQVDRGSVEEQEARLVLGDEDRPQAADRPTLTGQLGACLLRALGVPQGDVLVALRHVELDEVLSHGSTVLPGRGRRNYG